MVVRHLKVRLARAFAGAALLAWGGAVACDHSATTTTYDPYTGPPAYPDNRPKLPTPKGYLAFVSNNLSDTITVLDLPSNAIVAEVPVGRDPIGIDGPHHLVRDKLGNAFVALSYPIPPVAPGPLGAGGLGTRPGFVQKLAADDLRAVGEVQIDVAPGEIVITPDGSKVLVTHFDLARAADPTLGAEGQKATLAIIDTQTLAMTGTPAPIKVPLCRAPHGACVSADSKLAYVACFGDDKVAIVDLQNPTAPPTLVPSNGRGPYSAAMSHSGRLVAIGSTDGRETGFLDTTTRTMTDKSVLSQGVPFFAEWAPDDATLWIPTQAPDGLLAVAPNTGAIVLQRAFDATCVKPHKAVLSKDASSLYVICEGDHIKPGSIVELDPATLVTRASVAVGVYPDSLSFVR